LPAGLVAALRRAIKEVRADLEKRLEEDVAL